MTRSSGHVRPAVVGLLVLTLAAGACTTQRAANGSSDAMAGMAPMLSVERFLQAANARDFEAMGQLFGTADGPVDRDAQELELQMATMAEILRHQDYQIVSEQRAPGRENPTNRIGVNMRKNDQTIRDVGFFVVQTADGRWFVEQIELEKITGA